jgi:hypothetical protein
MKRSQAVCIEIGTTRRDDRGLLAGVIDPSGSLRGPTSLLLKGVDVVLL